MNALAEIKYNSMLAQQPWKVSSREYPATGHRLPTREAALAAKYSAIVSPYREWVKKTYDAGDLRSIVLAAPDLIDRNEAHRLGELIFPGGGDELLEFIQLSIDQKPFRV